MKITYYGAISILTEAAQKANALLNDDAFYNAISMKLGFYFTTATGIQIADSMKWCSLNLSVTTFKRILTRELGYEDANDPATIHINNAGNKLSRSVGSIVGTFIHEAVHAADADDESLDYPYDGNSSSRNEDTAPYWIENLAVQMIHMPGLLIDKNNIAVVPHAPDDEMA